MVGKRTFQNPREHVNELQNGDLESGPRERRYPKFRDVVDLTMAERSKSSFKDNLRSGFDRDAFEQFRKSDDEVW
jgi:hypothetical protein